MNVGSFLLFVRWLNAEGDEYEGGFQEGYRSGTGIYRRASTRSEDLYTLYEGEWVRDRRQGFGVQTSDVGTHYIGREGNESVFSERERVEREREREREK
jgi:MORN repeat